MELDILNTAVLSAAVVGFTQLVKKGKYVQERHLPLVAVLFGGLLAYLGSGLDMAWLLQGLLIGLGTTGLVSFYKQENNKK